MPNITPPVFADEHGDLTVFDSADSMSAYVELIDVENEEYEFFDSIGYRLTPVPRDGAVVFTIEDARSPEPEKLAALLRGYFYRLPKHLAEFSAKARTEASWVSRRLALLDFG